MNDLYAHVVDIMPLFEWLKIKMIPTSNVFMTYLMQIALDCGGAHPVFLYFIKFNTYENSGNNVMEESIKKKSEKKSSEIFGYLG